MEPVVSTSSTRRTRFPVSRGLASGGTRRLLQVLPPLRPGEPDLGRRALRPLEERIARQAARAGGDAAERHGLVEPAPPEGETGAGHRHDHVRFAQQLRARPHHHRPESPRRDQAVAVFEAVRGRGPHRRIARRRGPCRKPADPRWPRPTAAAPMIRANGVPRRSQNGRSMKRRPDHSRRRARAGRRSRSRRRRRSAGRPGRSSRGPLRTAGGDTRSNVGVTEPMERRHPVSPLPWRGDRGPFLDSFLPSYRPCMTAPVVFDRSLVRRRLARALRRGYADFLLARAVEDLDERLAPVLRTRTFSTSARRPPRPRSAAAPAVGRAFAPIPEKGAALSDEERLPFAERAFRSRRVAARPSGRERPARSAPADPPGAQAGRALRRLPPRRAALRELRQSFMAAEIEIEGASPRWRPLPTCATSARCCSGQASPRSSTATRSVRYGDPSRSCATCGRWGSPAPPGPEPQTTAPRP